ncbi:flagellar basal body rod protein FlgC [Sphingomonas sp.]|jgi:flagellar basal-body rod protein FlgC|uniref:flagellar basal body rod protein FlgC n=1 Tax=Sphingomonas sp. TaxID=28214 RepID=UPI002E338CDC|nr:flagellar basal body rod protein FlgC [Sphingomonas sp.]HEX4695801.1 flagellar basal body rod protein FlgC [Sphingomonas sp.]
MSDAMAISRSGLDVEWQRLQVIAQNLANMDTSRTASGDPYRPMRLVSGPDQSFAAALAQKGASDVPAAVRVMGVEAIPGGVKRVYDPSDPAAGADGFVSLPDIDQASEMTLMIRASRSYEANLTALAIERQMFSRALDLGHAS